MYKDRFETYLHQDITEMIDEKREQLTPSQALRVAVNVFIQTAYEQGYTPEKFMDLFMEQLEKVTQTGEFSNG